jgi:hypothetical protein
VPGKIDAQFNVVLDAVAASLPSTRESGAPTRIGSLSLRTSSTTRSIAAETGYVEISLRM